MNTAELDPPPAAAVPGNAAVESPADWPLARLLQHVDAHHARLGTAGVISVYQLWLAHHRGPESAGAHFNVAAVLQTAGRLAEAEHHYRELLRLMDLPQARYNLALVLERAARRDEALAQWGRVAASGAELQLRRQALAAMVRVARQTGRREALRRALAESLELDPDQGALRTELAALSQAPGAAPAAASAEPDPVIFVFAVCFNEAPILPFFLDHYVHCLGARKVVLHDGGSTDGSAEIAARYPEVEFIVSPSEKLDDRDLMRLRNEAWKPWREECDWIVVCDVDEFLYHPDIRQALKDLKRQGVTLPMVEGFNMISKSHPPHRPGRYLWQERQAGWADPRYLNKNLIFDPRVDINYTLGCHNCQPAGPVRRSEGFVFKNLHMCMPSYGHVIAKSRRSAARLSDWNKQTNAGFHYKINAELSRPQYNAKFLGAENVVERRPRPPLRREGLEGLLTTLTLLDQDARILELGVADGFGSAGDSASTECFAWYVHHTGGELLSIDSDARRRRHAGLELARRGLHTGRVSFAGPDRLAELQAEGSRFDLAYFNANDHYGDADDRAAGQRDALTQYLDVAPVLAPTAMVVLDGGRAACEGEGRFALLAALLQGQGWRAEFGVDMVVLQRPG